MIDEIAKRLVAHDRWQWMDGMRAEPGRVLGVSIGGGPRFIFGDWHSRQGPPDLTDPATMGCLIALLSDAMPLGWGHDFGCYGDNHGININDEVNVYRSVDGDFGDVDGAELGIHLAAALLWLWERRPELDPDDP